VDETVGANGVAGAIEQLNDLLGVKCFSRLSQKLLVYGVVIRGHHLDHLESKGLTPGKPKVGGLQETGDVLVGDGGVLARR
jgi:hypothetical protein